MNLSIGSLSWQVHGDAMPCAIGKLRDPLSSQNPDLDVLELTAQISLLAYDVEELAQEKASRLGFSSFRSLREGSLQACVLSKDDIIVIAFRGTDEVRDWLTNLKLRGVKWPPNGPRKVHYGFLIGYQSLQNKVRDELNRHGAPHRLWLTGHSLGGALALLCAFDLDSRYHIHGLVTFGQPMAAGDALLRNIGTALAGVYLRVVNGQDIVPRVPPWYGHAGNYAWIFEGKLTLEAPVPQRRRLARCQPNLQQRQTRPYDDTPLSIREFRELQDVLRNTPSREKQIEPGTPYGGSTVWLTDHSMQEYLKRIQELKNKPAHRPGE